MNRILSPVRLLALLRKETIQMRRDRITFAMMLGIPVEQWRKDFVFLTPNKYAFNYVSIGAPIDANVSLDGQPLPPDFWEKVSNTYKATKVFVGEGVHKVLSDQAVAVEVYGFDQYVSYGYAAGLDLKDLKLVKEPGE